MKGQTDTPARKHRGGRKSRRRHISSGRGIKLEQGFNGEEETKEKKNTIAMEGWTGGGKGWRGEKTHRKKKGRDMGEETSPGDGHGKKCWDAALGEERVKPGQPFIR